MMPTTGSTLALPPYGGIAVTNVRLYVFFTEGYYLFVIVTVIV
jgi:hypothetical protein